MANLSAFGGAQPITPGGLVELGYAEKTSHTTITSTSPTSPTATELSVTVVSDGSPMTVEFYCGEATPPNVNNGVMLAALWVDGAEYDRTMGVAYNYSDSVNSGRTIYAKKRITLAAGSHTIDIRGWIANNAGLSGYFYAGTNVSGFSPAYIRVSKIVQQNDGLKPFWTPPIVTALPANPQLGEQVTYYTVSGGYQAYQFVGTGWKILGRETPTFLTASSTNMETGPASSDFTYSAAQITITPGTWIVEAGARLINIVTTDSAAVAVWNETLGSEVPNSRGVANPSLTSLAFATLSRRTTLTVSSDTDLRVRCLRNGGSTIRVMSANASAGWPAAYVNAERIQIVEATA